MMGSYMTILNYKREDKNYPLSQVAQHQEECGLITENLLHIFSYGGSEEQSIKQEGSWSGNSEQIFQIWSMIPDIYRCPEYGQIKGVEGEDIQTLLEQLYALLKERVSDVYELVSEGLYYIDDLVSVISAIEKLKAENACILFEWG